MKVVHAADLHLDSPLCGLESYDGAPTAEVRDATRRALSGLVDLCLDEGAALLLVAGDLYDGDWKDYSTGLFFLEQMARLGDRGVEVVWIRGNHDAASKITRHLTPPAHVRELSTERAETVRFENLGVAVHGIGYASRDITENLAETYPPPVPGYLNFGLLHTAVDGRPGHAPYAPCSLNQLKSHGYDYWALGHVHAREVLSQEPWVVFPGNLQGRHIREPGEKGATVIQIDGGKIVKVRHQAVDVVRWAVTAVDLSAADDLEGALELIHQGLRREVERADGRLLATRLELSGRTRAHGELVCDAQRLQSEVRAQGLSIGGIYVEKVSVKTAPPRDPTQDGQHQDALASLFSRIKELRGLAQPAAINDEEPRAAERELAAEVFSGLDNVPPGLVAELSNDFEGVLEEAERLLLGRLLSEPGKGPRS